ncbi:MAG: transcriptional regulator, AraC family [Candidatus Solibacter sp.]|nr:transcriptional regulator, AraC family [Candidatus Solibacter sp.]
MIVRSLATQYASGFRMPEHAHPWRQLLYAISGAMTVYAGRWSWMIPPGKAVFVPAGCRHSIRMWGEVAMRSLYLPATLEAPAECFVLSVTPLLRELILRVIECPALDSRVPEHVRLAAVLLDEIACAPVTPLSLPVPADPRAAAVAHHVLAGPADDDSLHDLGRLHGAGRRTLERLFRAETGMSFGIWRQQARLLHSISALAEGKPVTEASLDAGYASVSAYIAAFKRTFGCTPGKL